jgi:HlyD family secretion protein
LIAPNPKPQVIFPLSSERLMLDATKPATKTVSSPQAAAATSWHIGTVSPKKVGLWLAGLGAAFHLFRVGLVVLGRAEPHSLGSLSFPATAAIIITGTAGLGFVIGAGMGVVWNRLTELAPKVLLRVATALIVAIAVAGFGVWRNWFSPVAVHVTQTQSNVAVQVFGLGTVEARVASKIGFKVSGVLVDLRSDVGDRVAKGAILARLDDREQMAQLGRARAAVEQAEANLQKATASVKKSEANYANAKSINERRQKLVQGNIASVETAETAKAAADAAFAEMGVSQSDVSVAKAAIDDARAQQQLQQVTLDFHSLTAPYDAMVTARLKDLGSSLAANEPVFTLIDPTTIWVLAYVDESKAGEIEVGQPTEIILRSHPHQRLQGRVARIEPESDRVNEERRIEVAFDHIPAYANLGEQAEVYFTTVRLARAMLVPEAAILGLTKDRGTVWTVEDSHLQQRSVILGHRLLDGRYEITGNLPPGATVVTQLQSGLRVGRAATIASEPKR